MAALSRRDRCCAGRCAIGQIRSDEMDENTDDAGQMTEDGNQPVSAPSPEIIPPSPKTSKIALLPPEIRDMIARLRREGHSIDEIRAELRQLDLPPGALPTRSGFCKYINRLDREGAEERNARAVAGMLTEKIAGMPQSRRMQRNIELLEILIARLTAAAMAEFEKGAAATLAPERIHTLAKALESLLRSHRAEIDASLLVRKEKVAATKKAKPAEEEGLSAERIAFLKAKIAGLKLPDPKPPTK